MMEHSKMIGFYLEVVSSRISLRQLITKTAAMVLVLANKPMKALKLMATLLLLTLTILLQEVVVFHGGQSC